MSNANANVSDTPVILHLLGKIRELENECYHKLIQQHDLPHQQKPQLTMDALGAIIIKGNPNLSTHAQELGEKEQEILKLTHELAVRRNQFELLEKEKKRQMNLVGFQENKKREIYVKAQKLKQLGIWNSIRDTVLACFDGEDEPELFQTLALEQSNSLFLGKRAEDSQIEREAPNWPASTKSKTSGNFFSRSLQETASGIVQGEKRLFPYDDHQSTHLENCTASSMHDAPLELEVTVPLTFAKPAFGIDPAVQTKRPGEGIANFISSVSELRFPQNNQKPFPYFSTNHCQPSAEPEKNETNYVEQQDEKEETPREPEQNQNDEPQPQKYAAPFSSLFKHIRPPPAPPIDPSIAPTPKETSKSFFPPSFGNSGSFFEKWGTAGAVFSQKPELK